MRPLFPGGFSAPQRPLRFFVLCLLGVLLWTPGGVADDRSGTEEPSLELLFQDVRYFHRWSEGTQHEFTPADQDVRGAWTDMLTLLAFEDVREGDGLADMANRVLGIYQQAGGHILRTASLPATELRPAEHMVVVVFVQPDFSEAAFVRFKLAHGIGMSVVYSHRIHGDAALPLLNRWLEDKLATTQQALADWEGFPEPAALP